MDDPLAGRFRGYRAFYRISYQSKEGDEQSTMNAKNPRDFPRPTCLEHVIDGTWPATVNNAAANDCLNRDGIVRVSLIGARVKQI